MTECNQSSFGFQACGSREIVARFDGGTISSDGGALLLRQTDQRLNLLPRLAECFLDGRDPQPVEHSVEEMVSQRVYGLALGYEGTNDHEQLRTDPLFSVLSGREELERPLAGKSTLNRLELGDGTEDRYKKITFWKQNIDELLVSVLIESQEKAPEEISWTWTPPTCRCTGSRRGGSSTATTTATVTCRFTSSAASTFSVRVCGSRTATRMREAWRRSNGSCGKSARPGRGEDHPARGLRFLPQRVDELV